MRERSARVSIFALLLVLGLSLGVRLPFVAQNALSYDESHILTFGTLAAQGFAPYREVFAGIPPAALTTVEASAYLFGAASWVRLPLVLLGVVGVGLLFDLVRRSAPKYPVVSAALAALFFSFNPAYFAVSNTLNLEAAALTFGLLAVWAMQHHSEQPRVGWLLLSGAAFALSLGYKILLPFLPGVILVQMVLLGIALPTRRAQLGALLRWGLLWLLGVALVLLVVALWFDPPLVYQQVIDFRLDLRAVTVAGSADVNVTEDLHPADLLALLPLLVGALASVPLLRHNRPTLLWVWGAWLLLGLLMLRTHIPLRPRHLVIVLPPLAVLSAVAITGGWARLHTRVARGVLGVVVVLLVVTTAGWAWMRAPIPDFTLNQPARANVIDYIRATTSPTDCIVSKENRFYFLTDRFPPPFLSEVSTSRLFSQKLTLPALVDELQRRDCALLVYANSYDELAPGLYAAAQDDYALTLTIGTAAGDEPITLFAVPTHRANLPTLPQAADLGGQIRLTGIDVTPGEWTPGQTVYLSTYWQTLQPPTTDYRLFVHVVDGDGQLVLAADHFPFEAKSEYSLIDVALNPRYLEAQGKRLPANYPNAGLIPTQLWRPGATLKETIAFDVDLAPGRYTLQIGMFDPVTGARLDVDDSVEGGVENHVVLGTFAVK